MVASYDFQPGNLTGLFWKKEIYKSGSKRVRKQISKKESVRKEECKKGK